MSDRTAYFSRISDRVHLDPLSEAFVVMVGVGSVGSAIAQELARCGVGHLALLDGDRLEVPNLSRHALPDAYLGANKAEAMASHLSLNVPGLDVAGAPHHLDDSFSDAEIDRCLAAADLVVIATDRRASQRRIASRALAMDIPAVIPGLYADRGGEVFVQLSPAEACFMCWDGFRDANSEVRSVSSVNADALGVVQHAIYLCLAVLDPHSRHARDLAPPPTDPRPRQLFVQRPGAALLRASVVRRPECSGCAVGPSPLAGANRAGGDTSDLFEGLLVGHQRQVAAGWRFTLNGAAAPPEIDFVRVSEPLVVESSTVTLSWRAANATHVVIDTLGTHPPEGSLEILITDTTAFRVNAVNPFGESTALSPVIRTMPLPRVREIALATLPAVELADAPTTALRLGAQTNWNSGYVFGSARTPDSSRAPGSSDARNSRREPSDGRGVPPLPVLDLGLPVLPELPRIFDLDAQLEPAATITHDNQDQEERR
jgi:molybdopterin/thiamine biosynthesis adenylyltransferase